MTNYVGYEVQVFYKLESSQGVTPAGQWKALAQKAKVEFLEEPAPNFTPKSGSVDMAKGTKGVPQTKINLTYTPSMASGKDFIHNFISTDSSFSLLLVKIDVSNTVFQRLVGCKCKRTNPTGQLMPQGKDVQVVSEIWAWDTIFTDEGSTPSYESVPDSVLSWSNVTIKTVADPSGTNPPRNILTQWNNFSWTVDNDLYRIVDNNGHTTDIRRGERKCTGSFEFVTTGNSSTEITVIQTAVYQDIEFLFGSDSYLFNDALYTILNLGYGSGEMAIKKIDFQGATLVIS